jgi:hypothetical protein
MWSMLTLVLTINAFRIRTYVATTGAKVPRIMFVAVAGMTAMSIRTDAHPSHKGDVHRRFGKHRYERRYRAF